MNRKTLIAASETRPVRRANPARNVPAEPASETPIRRFAVETDGARIYLREVVSTFAFPLNWSGREGLTREGAWSYVRAQDKPVTTECLGEEPMDLGVVFDVEAFERAAYAGYTSYGRSMSDGYYAPICFEHWVISFRKNPNLDHCDVSPLTRESLPTYVQGL